MSTACKLLVLMLSPQWQIYQTANTNVLMDYIVGSRPFLYITRQRKTKTIKKT